MKKTPHLSPLSSISCRVASVIACIALVISGAGCTARPPSPEGTRTPPTAAPQAESAASQEQSTATAITPQLATDPTKVSPAPTELHPKQPQDPKQRKTDKPQAPPARGIRFSKEDEVWIDTERHEVIVGGTVCLREGMLEMFACPEGTKEHESVIALKSKAAVVHAALLAVGAKPGHPAQFDPQYVPAKGPVVDIDVTWTDAEGKAHTTRAQNWVVHLPTGKPMSQDWVFGGSSFWKDPATQREYYQAEGGELICVSNFSTATLDLPVNSSQSTAELLFGAFTKNIPELGTPVRLVLRPRL